MTITPGRGTDKLRLRQTSSSVLDQLGAPARKRRVGKLRDYWVYPDRGIEVVVSRHTHHLLSILVDFRANPADSPTERLTMEQVRDRFGIPSSEGGGVVLGDGTYFGRWFSYDAGIGFQFDRTDKVETISIFARRRRSTQTASHATRSSGQLAALRI
jgi:hypothetical protein